MPESNLEDESTSIEHSVPSVQSNPIDDLLNKFDDPKGWVEAKTQPNTSVEVISPDGKEGTLPEHEVPDALKDGFKLVTPETDLVSVKNKDGVIGTLPKEELEDAIASGEYLPLNQDDKKTDKYLDELNNSEFTSSLKTFGEGAASMVPILGTYVEDKINEDPHFARAFKQFEDEHPVAHYAGKAAGFGGTMWATAGLGNAVMGTKAVASFSPLAKVMIRGSVWGAPEAVEDAIKGDYIGAAESLAFGVGTELGLHGIAKGVSAIKNKVIPKIQEVLPGKTAQQELNDAHQLISKEFGVSPKQAKQFESKLPEIYKQAGVTSKDSANSMLKKVSKFSDETEKSFGDTIKKLDEVPNKEQMIEQSLFKSSDEIKNLTSKLIGPQKKEADRALDPILKQINEVSKQTKLTFEQTEGLKKYINSKSNNEINKEAFSILENNLQYVENKIASSLSDPSVLHSLQNNRLVNSVKEITGDLVSKLDAKIAEKTPLGKLFEMFPKQETGDVVQNFIMHSVAGAILGGSISEDRLIGAAKGALTGLAINKGSYFLKQILENRKFGKAIGNVIKNSMTPGADVVLASNKLINDEIASKAKSFLSDMTNKYKGAVVSNGLNAWLQDGGQGKTKQQQIDELKNLAQLQQVNPELVNQHLNEITQPLRDEGLDLIADQYTQHQLRLMKVIDSVLPNNPKMDVAHPFAAEVKKQDISKVAVAQYEKALHLAADPTHLFELVKNNTISQKDIAIVAATNPQTYQKMKNELLKESMKSKPDLSYQQRLSMGILMGENIDASTTMIPQLQSIYMQQPPMAQPQKPKLSAKATDRIDNSVKTGSQKSAGN